MVQEVSFIFTTIIMFFSVSIFRRFLLPVRATQYSPGCYGVEPSVCLAVGGIGLAQQLSHLIDGEVSTRRQISESFRLASPTADAGQTAERMNRCVIHDVPHHPARRSGVDRRPQENDRSGTVGKEVTPIVSGRS
jgi:hypothetical protein